VRMILCGLKMCIIALSLEGAPFAMNLEHQITWHLAKYPQIKLSVLFGSFVRRQGGLGRDLDLTIAGDWLVVSDEKKCP